MVLITHKRICPGLVFLMRTFARVGSGPVGIGLSYSNRVTNYGNDTTVGIGIGL